VTILDRITPSLARVIAGLLRYSMADIEWNFDHLTADEKTIVGNQETLDLLRAITED
jgi:hypothetical protein